MTTRGGVETMSTLVRGGALSLGGSLLGRAASVAQSIVIARSLDPHRLGVFAVLNYVLGLGGAIVDLGVPVATAKLVAEYRVTRPSALRRIVGVLAGFSLVLASVGAVLLLAGATPLSDFYREPSLAPLLRLGAVLLFIALVGAVLASSVQGLQRIDTLAAVTAVKAVIALGATLVLLPSLGLVGVLLASIVAEVVAWPILGHPLRQALAATPGVHAEVAAAGPIVARALELAAPVVLNGLVVWGGAWFVRSYLARTVGYEAVGYFHVADACARLLLLLPSAIAVPFLPAVAEAVALGHEAMRRMVEGGLRLTLLVAAPAGTFLCLAAEPVLGLIYGDAYARASASLTSALVLAAGFQAVAVMVWSTLVGAGRTWPGFAVQAVGQLALVTLTVALVPAHELAGVAVAGIVASVATAGLGLTVVRRELGVRVTAVRRALTVSVIGWAAAGALSAAAATGWLEAAALAAVVAVLQFYQLTPDEQRAVLERLRRPVAEVAR